MIGTQQSAGSTNVVLCTLDAKLSVTVDKYASVEAQGYGEHTKDAIESLNG